MNAAPGPRDRIWTDRVRPAARLMGMIRIALVACALLGCCDRDDGSAAPARVFVAAGRLAIDLPAVTEASHRDAASAFTLDPGTRSPRLIDVIELAPGATPSDMRWSESEGGSGGTEYHLRGALRRCGAVFEIRCSAQTEDGRPDMDWCRDAIASLRCRPPG
jgi:hypothetical protein